MVGRFDTRRFVAIPRVGASALDLLRAGHTIEQATSRLSDAEGQEFDVLSFARDLMELGFIAQVDGRPVPDTAAPPASFPEIRPEHVRFALSPVLPALFVCLMCAAAVALVARPDLLPTYRDLLWSPAGSAVLALSVAAGWTLVFVHELAHFVVARATGVPARITLSTRLQFLVAETDISGIEFAPRRHRLTAYLAGMAVNLAVAAVAILLAAVTDQAAHRILAATVVIALLPLPFQFMVFMRTDIYFVLQDLTACRDLYGDGAAYARYLAKRLRQRILRQRNDDEDPSLALPPHERRAVRAYSAVLVLGTALCLAALAAFTLPADLTLIYRAATRLGPEHSLAANADSVAVLLILGTLHLIWAVTWFRRRHRFRRRSARRVGSHSPRCDD